jgi:hypothetical protein
VAASWPCRTCGEAVALTDDSCPSCGAGFLSALAGEGMRLPGVGDVRALSGGQKAAVMVVGTLAVMAVLLALGLVLGALV